MGNDATTLPATSPAPATAPTPVVRAGKKRRALRALGAVSAVSAVSVVGLWGAIHRYPELTGQIVNAVRAVVGPKPIAFAEDTAYAVQDALNRWRYKDAAPAAYWEAPANGDTSGHAYVTASAAVDASASAGANGAASGTPSDGKPAFAPAPFDPPYPNVALAGDGRWMAMPTPQDPSAPPALYKALVHPDPKRSYAVVAVVAIDLSRVEMGSVPGFGEPASGALAREKRPGMVPAEDQGDLLATFNGGFQAVHGQWGMMNDGVTLLAARPIGCTVARYKDGSMRVAVWKRMADTEGEMKFFRQTPPCLVEDGVVNPATNAENNTGWGATVDGDTVIRRSAFGLDKEGKTAFYGMGDGLSAGTLAKAMRAAGAWDVAQLDVNWSYPRFFSYDGGAQPKIAQPLAPVQNWKPDEYVGRPAYRDFFYLKRKKAG